MKVVAMTEFFRSVKYYGTWSYRIGTWFYKLKCWLYKRYSTIKPRHLGHTWIDRSELMPHAMFEILEQFIEEECSPGHNMVEVYGQPKNVMDEMKDLLKWWNEIYLPYFNDETELQNREIPEAISWFQEKDGYFEFDPKYNSKEEEEIVNNYYKELNSFDTRMHKELLEKMHRLVNVSPYMWT